MGAHVPPTREFDIGGPLPRPGTTLIEASAGTGKTFALVGLALRFLAETDLSISQLLLVTFTRAAADEMRQRLRSALGQSVAALRAGDASEDPLAAVVYCDDPDERHRRMHRLGAAVEEFDAATITTIHGFCAQVIRSAGLRAEQFMDTAVIAGEDEVLRQSCVDLLFSEAADTQPLTDGVPTVLPTVGQLVQLVKTARRLGESDVTVESGAPDDFLRARLLSEAVDEVDRRLRSTGTMTFNRLIRSVRDLLQTQPGAAASLARRYKVGLIDEFQDTDQMQWQIFDAIFGASSSAHPTLILVGDPKQAIYSFRGGDVYSYLSVSQSADTMELLTNHRSSPRLVKAMNTLCAGHIFGEPAIRYTDVKAASRNRLLDISIPTGPGRPRSLSGIELRCLDEPELKAPDTKRAIRDDLVGVVRNLLENAEITAADGTTRSVSPSDIAVLCSSNASAPPIADALRRAGVPATMLMVENVLVSPAADQLRTLLGALNHSSDDSVITAASMTCFFEMAPEQLALGRSARQPASGHDPAVGAGQNQPAALESVRRALSQWERALTSGGIMAMWRDLIETEGVMARLIGSVDGPRMLTDLEHIVELIHVNGPDRGGTHPSTALHVLDELSNLDDEVTADMLQRRIDSDAPAVRLTTIHRSKGLEFPIVLLPTIYSAGKATQIPSIRSYFDPSSRSRVIDVSTKQLRLTDDGSTPKELAIAKVAPRSVDESQRQSYGEQHRLTYVALTRASHLVVAWWKVGAKTSRSGLARLLFTEGDDSAANVPTDLRSVDQVSYLKKRFESSDSVLRISSFDVDQARLPVPAGAPDAVSSPAMAARRLKRQLERDSFRWSFSRLARNIDLGAESRLGGSTQRTPPPNSQTASPPSSEAPVVSEAPATLDWAVEPPLDTAPAGAAFGSFVHAVLEDIDTSSPDLDQVLISAMTAQVARDRRIRSLLSNGVLSNGVLSNGVLPNGVGAAQAEIAAVLSRLSVGLAQSIRTPLGAAFDDLSLADVEPLDQVKEMDFLFSLPNSGSLEASAVGQMILDHLTPDDPFREWARGLTKGLSHIRLRGFLSGSIDLVFRYEIDGGTRYSLADFKTNRLGSGKPSSLFNYQPRRLFEAMVHHDYPFQALIYQVALHRFLRWRVPAYSPESHLGPIAYLFLRGMVGPSTPTTSGHSASHGSGGSESRAGVLTWHVPAKLVTDLSDLLADSDCLADSDRLADSDSMVAGE